MRLRDKRKRNAALVLALCVLSWTLAGCGNLKYDMPYDANTRISGFDVTASRGADLADPFAERLCVIIGDYMTDSVNVDGTKAAVLMDVTHSRVLYSMNAHEKLHPASLTKIMTALVAIKYGSMDQVLRATEGSMIKEKGAQLLGIKPGDSMTLDQALRILLLYSANDVAALVAEGVGGSVDGFVNMMNEEANRIGATNTHFTNPHGLTDEEHLTTAYDLYLIFNEAMKYETFNEIIQMTSYQTTYYNSAGGAKDVNIRTTNLFLRGDVRAPENVTIIGGKTGTTSAAGNCLALLSRDMVGNPYISIILNAQSRDTLYAQMADLLDEINN